MLRSKVALVTGSTSGIGLGIARALAKQGCSVLLNGLPDPSGPDTRRLCDELCGLGAPRAEFADNDVADATSAAELVHQAPALLGGPVSVLVNNAGIQTVSPVDQFPLDRWESILKLNLSSNFYTTRARTAHTSPRAGLCAQGPGAAGGSRARSWHIPRSLSLPGRAAVDARARLGTHHQRGLGARYAALPCRHIRAESSRRARRSRGLAVQSCLRRGEAWRCRADKGA